MKYELKPKFMRKKIILNFWHALLLLIGINIIFFLIGITIKLLFKVSFKSNLSFVSIAYSYVLLYVPFIFLFAKKTNTNFKKSLFIPDIMTVIKMLVILMLMIIVLGPLSRTDLFFESLMNSKLRITGTAIRPWIPWIGLEMVLFGPIIEEFLFRGLILKNFLKRYSPINSILLSSLLFGLHHLSNITNNQNYYNLILYIIAGIILGILYYKTNSLIIVSLAHIIWNASTFLYWEYIELDIANTILHSIVYITALGLLIFQLKKGLKRPVANTVS